jgi:hypothetical protein
MKPTSSIHSPITEEKFITMTGVKPVQDDLDRCNCPESGELGHRMCGVCSLHNKPRFVCGCTVRNVPIR